MVTVSAGKVMVIYSASCYSAIFLANDNNDG